MIDNYIQSSVFQSMPMRYWYMQIRLGLGLEERIARRESSWYSFYDE